MSHLSLNMLKVQSNNADMKYYIDGKLTTYDKFDFLSLVAKSKDSFVTERKNGKVYHRFNAIVAKCYVNNPVERV